MKNCISRVFGAAVTALVLTASLFAQDDSIAAAAGSKYLISAKAGGVNFVQGAVGVVRTEGKSGYLLKGDKLEIGDRVSTGADGKVEILLNPGSYLRLGANSAFEFNSTSLDDLQVKLDAGSAILEVFATEDFVVSVNTPKTKLSLIESGIYRVDVGQGDVGKIAVWKGKARIGDDEKAVVKSGREGSMLGSALSVSKFDRDDKDDLEIWSKSRAKDLAKITASLERNTMRTALMRSFLGRQWNMYNSFGLWVYDPWSRSNCFLPFGWGWGSPYGYGFGNNIGYYGLPRVVYYQPPGGSGPVVSNPETKNPRNPRLPPVDGPVRPPFAQVQGSSGSTGRDFPEIKPGRTGIDYNPSVGSEPIRSSGGYSGGGASSPSTPPPTRSEPVEVKRGRP
ncbi:MAG: FecR domain-containing protein [Acidobacteria bacterium]|nr:FecR domain-containing protein [Acidobacteriota bacterium]